MCSDGGRASTIRPRWVPGIGRTRCPGRSTSCKSSPKVPRPRSAWIACAARQPDERQMRAILRDAAAGKWRLFERPRELVVARALADVVPALQKIESECAKGVYAAGFIAYE